MIRKSVSMTVLAAGVGLVAGALSIACGQGPGDTEGTGAVGQDLTLPGLPGLPGLPYAGFLLPLPTLPSGLPKPPTLPSSLPCPPPIPVPSAFPVPTAPSGFPTPPCPITTPTSFPVPTLPSGLPTPPPL